MQEEELDLKPECLLRMRWVLTWKYTEGGDRKAKARLVILGYQHSELTSVLAAAPTLGKMSRHLLLQACDCTNFGSILVTFPQRSCKHLPRKNIKPCPICTFVEIVLWTHVSIPCVVVFGHHTETFSAWMETHVD